MAVTVYRELRSLVAGIFHPDREHANNHSAAFAEYTASADWIAVHLSRVGGMAVVIAGLLVLFIALNVYAGVPRWASWFGAISTGGALALYGVLQVVDGPALPERRLSGACHQHSPPIRNVVDLRGGFVGRRLSM